MSALKLVFTFMKRNTKLIQLLIKTNLLATNF